LKYRVTCSRKCSNILRKSKSGAWKKAKCVYCGKSFDYNTHTHFGKFCNKKCESYYRQSESNKKYSKLFEKGKLLHRRQIYRVLVEKFKNKCSICGITEWNNMPIRFWVDHINGNPADNTPENFRLICPNCESQTETSRGKNYGNGRKSRGLPCYS